MADPSKFLRAAVDIGHLGARVEHESVLLEAAVDMLHRQFELTAAQVYVVDGMGLFGELRHHAGAGDHKLIMRTPGVPVGANSVLGTVLAKGEKRVLRDMIGLPHSAIPTGAQRGMALPLNVEGKVLGALVLYASELDAPMMSDPDSFASLADMLALALDGVRSRSDKAGERVAPTRLDDVTVSRPVAQTSSRASAQYHPAGEEGESSDDHYTAPIRMGGSVIGSMSFRGASEETLEPEDKALIDSVSDQVGQAIENLSQLDGAQRIARREQLINEVTGHLQRATSVEEVLQTAVESIRQALGDVEVTARLAPEAVEPEGASEAKVGESEAT